MSPDKQNTGRVDWPRALMAHYMYLMIRKGTIYKDYSNSHDDSIDDKNNHSFFLFGRFSCPHFCPEHESPKARYKGDFGTIIFLHKTGKDSLRYLLSFLPSADGGGVPNLNPPLIQTSYVLGDKYSLIKIVLNGFQKPVDIDGESYSNNMPPLNSLKDQQIADVLTYIRNNFDNKAGAVNPADVQKVRSTVKK